MPSLQAGGEAEVDIEIPKALVTRFEGICPFFYSKEVPFEVVPQQLLGCLKNTVRKGGDEK